MAGALKPFVGRLEEMHYQPLDATPAIADAMAKAYADHRANWA